MFSSKNTAPPSNTLVTLDFNWNSYKNQATKTTLQFPASFDCRIKWPGCISTARSQGSCGSCWAFASVSALGDRFCCMTTCSDKSECTDKTTSSKTIDLIAEDVLHREEDELFGLQKLTLRHTFYSLVLHASNNKLSMADLKKISSPNSKTKNLLAYLDNLPCSSDQFKVLLGTDMKVDIKQWLNYFISMYNTINNPSITVSERGRALGTIAAMEIGAPEGLYLPLNSADSIQVAAQKMRMYFNFWDAQKDGFVDLCEWEQTQRRGPVRLSVQKVIVCYTSNTTKPSAGLANLAVSSACIGSTLTGAWQYLRDWGTPTESCVGYTLPTWDESGKEHILPQCRQLIGKDGNVCPGYITRGDWDALTANSGEGVDSQSSTLQPLLKMYRCINAYTICGTPSTGGSCDEIMMEIMENGPVSTGYVMHSDFETGFGGRDGMGGQGYYAAKGMGLQPEVLGSSQTSLIYKWDGVSRETGGHSVAITGWGEFEGVPYWVLRNSWGGLWGNEGYFWMLRGSNECGIEENVVAGLPDVAGMVYPGTAVQRTSVSAKHVLLPPGFGCAYENDGGITCQDPPGHLSPSDLSVVNGRLVVEAEVSPIAYFWPETSEAEAKRKELYAKIMRTAAESSSVPIKSLKLLEQKSSSDLRVKRDLSSKPNVLEITLITFCIVFGIISISCFTVYGLRNTKRLG